MDDRSDSRQGMLVTIEGIDGTGKSTLIQELVRRLATEVYRVVCSREPTDLSPWGKRLRASAEAVRLSPAEELEHFHRDRQHHLSVLIQPQLQQGALVLLDRYYDSTIAYQGARGFSVAELEQQIAEYALIPDLTLILELPLPVALNRIHASRAACSTFEQEDQLRRVQAIFAARRGDHYRMLDAKQPVDQVTNAALQYITTAPAFQRVARE